MRFHIGFSKRISFKWILLILGGLAAFFGIDKAFAATAFSVDASNVLVLSPQANTYIPELGQTITSGNFINQRTSTPYFGDWESQRYSAFKTITSPYTAIGYRDSIQNARLRWDFTTSSMAKCSSGQYITYEFKVYLRTIQSGTLPQLWDTADLYDDILLRTSDTNYTCTKTSSGHVMKVTCTIPNPSASVYFHIEGFTIPYGSVIDNGYYNVGVAPISYQCSSDSSGLIINNNNQNTEQIINNNNQNTQQIIDSQQDINNSINNDDVQSGTSHGGDFFNNTQINDHGISIIATAPIRLLQGMLNSGSSCNDLILTNEIFGQDKLITMPSGCILWSNAPSSIVSIYHITIFGLFGYYVLVDIWHTINAVIDPERKNDYVMDL